MGKSDKPLLRYSTSEMAHDLLELLDHLGWTSLRTLNISGVSMGGMIAQELALLIPSRINSLNLISTAAYIENTTSFFENLWNRINMFIPKSLDRSLTDAALMLFSTIWLDSPDDTIVPTSSTPGVIMPAHGYYKSFSTNFERFAAQELKKRNDPEQFGKKGFMLQAIAAGWHYKSPEQLKEMGDKVGRERISVVHGTSDRMISVPHGKKLIAWLDPGKGEIVEGKGHVFMLEEWRWHNNLIREGVERGMRVTREESK
jgi:pimeloyl-ACP methyl ester carboxylesterase